MLALVGLGYWGPNLLRNFNKLGVVEAAFDLNESRLEEYYNSPTYKDIYFGNDWEVCLGRSDIKGVAIATPPDTHFEIAKKALLSGKHVFCEKPLTLKVEHAEELVNIAKDKNLILMVGHTFLYSSEIRKIKEFIELGLLGDILYIISNRLNLGKFQKSGVIEDLMPHDISICNFLVGSSVRKVRAAGYSFIHGEAVFDEVAFVDLVYDNGVVANLNVSWLYPVKERKLAVVGSKRMLIYDMMASEKIKVFDKGVDKKPNNYGEYLLSYRHGDTWSPDLPVIEPLFVECSHFIECIKHGIRPFTDGINGLEVVKVLNMILDEVKKNGD